MKKVEKKVEKGVEIKVQTKALVGRKRGFRVSGLEAHPYRPYTTLYRRPCNFRAHYPNTFGFRVWGLGF